MKHHTAITWNELITPDIEGAKAFYSELFGWELRDEDMGERTYTIAKSNNTEVAGMMGTPPEAEGMPARWGAYVSVANVDASAASAEKLGGTVIVEPRDIPGVGRICVIADPQGAIISMISYSE